MRDVIGGGKVGVNSFGSQVFLDEFNNRIFNHEVFGVAKRFPIPASGVVDIVIDPTENGAFPKENFIFLPFVVEAKGAGPIEIDIYIDPDSDPDGTLWESIDRNFDGSLTAHTVVRLNPTINSTGIKSPTEYILESAAGQGNTADVGGEVKQDLLIIPLKTISVLVRITNTDTTNSARGHFVIDWFEF